MEKENGRPGGLSSQAMEPQVSPPKASIPDVDERYWMKEPCGPCPFSRSKTLFLHPERAQDFADMACNPYSDFVCHKTGETVESYDGGSSEIVRGEQSFTCNGFLSLQVCESGLDVEGFTPHSDAFDCSYEMAEHHEEEWERQKQERAAKATKARRVETTVSIHAGAVSKGNLPGEPHD